LSTLHRMALTQERKALCDSILPSRSRLLFGFAKRWGYIHRLSNPSTIWLVNILLSLTILKMRKLLKFYVSFTYQSLTQAYITRDILVKVSPASHLEAAFYLQYDFRTKKNLVIVAGNDLDGHFDMLVEHFKRAKPPYEPFAIALVIIMRYFRFIEAQRLEVDHAVIMTERETGRGAVAYSTGKAPKSVSPENFDLTFMHWIEGNQRNVVYAAHFQVKLVAFLIAQHLRFVQQREGSAIEADKLTRADRQIHERLKSHESMVEGLHAWCLVVRERIQRQLSAVSPHYPL